MIYLDWYQDETYGATYWRTASLGAFMPCPKFCRHRYRTFTCKRLVWAGGE